MVVCFFLVMIRCFSFLGVRLSFYVSFVLRLVIFVVIIFFSICAYFFVVLVCSDLASIVRKKERESESVEREREKERIIRRRRIVFADLSGERTRRESR